VGLSLIPAFGTLYQRLTLPESTRFEKTKLTQNLESVNVSIATRPQQDPQSDHCNDLSMKGEHDFDNNAPRSPSKAKAHFKEVLAYFREWRHLRLIIGTASCWFLVDIAFYGINLNQNVVLQQIGFDGSLGTPWERLFKIATGNIIITVLGLVPGYWVTVLTIEKLGRKFIQIQGFVMTSVFCEFFNYYLSTSCH
jgi:PHS family inorganic phosphate transporter-like MFS transporter